MKRKRERHGSDDISDNDNSFVQAPSSVLKDATAVGLASLSSYADPST